jgi:HNH endonuclease
MRIRKRVPNDTPFEDRFWMYATPGPMDECWEWQGSINASGYGQLTYKNKHWPAHRASYIINVGAVPEGINVCHKCDNRCCVNFAHLFLATQSENMIDAVAKGRLPFIESQIKRGEATKLAKQLKHKQSLDRLRIRIQRVVGPIEISDEALERFYDGDSAGAFAIGNKLHVGRERDSMGHFI